MVRLAVNAIVLLILADVAFAEILNTTLNDIQKNDLIGDTRRHRDKKKKKDKSTSSSSRDRNSDDDNDESLDISESETSSDDDKNKKYVPVSSHERRGWRKWHRKCHRCPEDHFKKWRDPSIKWICGAYQRARRSFKSLCMMHYRNCQDGTMFVKIGDHRCPNSTDKEIPYGDHFFYDYKVTLLDDSSNSKEDTTSSETSKSIY